MSPSEIDKLSLGDVVLAPPQVLGGVRIIPLLRKSWREDLRLSKQVHYGEFQSVQVDRKMRYASYLPHSLIANWTNDGSAVFGTQILSPEAEANRASPSISTSSGLRKLVQRNAKRELQFLPLHVAMEGLLALHFRGPHFAWSEYSNQAHRSGLGVRTETSIQGKAIRGLEDALNQFEIHQNQCGTLLFVADAFAAAFLLPHPEDYRALHHTLLLDFYGELLWHYGQFAQEYRLHPDPIRNEEVSQIDELALELAQLRQRWMVLGNAMIQGLFDRPIDRQRVYRLQSFTMNRFITDLNPNEENHIGELIEASDGSVQYLKTYRLTSSQTKRAYLLRRLAEHHWNLTACAEAENCRHSELCLRLKNAGFGYLLHQHVLDAAAAAERNRSS